MSYSIKVKLYTSKTYANGEHPIVIQVIKDKKIKKIMVGETCSKDLWDLKENLPKRKHPFYHELESKIGTQKKEIKDLYLNLEKEKKNFSLDDIEQKYRISKKIKTVFQFIDEIVEKLVKADKIGNAGIYKDLKRVLGVFNERNDPHFSEITVAFLNNLKQYFQEKKMLETSISIYFRTLRAVYNKAIVVGYAKQADYPFDKFLVSQFKTNTKKRAIPKDEILKIFTLNIPESSNLYDTRQMFMFSYLCWGINLFDIAQLEWSNIVNGKLEYTRSKTNEYFSIRLLPQALEILDYYRSFRANDYIFPILSKEVHKTAVSIKYRYEKKLTQHNQKLKEIAKLADISTNLTFYVARHSFATILKRSGTSTSKIREMMGHTSEYTTQIYLDSFENEELYNESKNLT